MNVVNLASAAVNDVKNHWRVPAEGNYVSYKEIASLSFGRMGMRLATTFHLTQEDFVCNTLGMSQFQRVYMGYATTAINLGKNLLNGYILDNYRNPAGRFRCYIKFGIPAGIILLLALLFIPFDKLAAQNIWYMISVSYSLGQIQGYISGWYGTGINCLNQVITPNTTERTKVIAIEGIIHNIAPTITDIAISVLKEKSFGFYDIRSFRVAYSPFIIIGTALSLLSFYGTEERLLLPRSRMTRIGFTDAFREVSRNRIFWIRMLDSWNDFLEGAKGNLLSYVFTYGEVAKGASNVGLKYGIARDVVGSASLFAMAMTPTMVRLFGKGRYKFYKNIIQIFLIFGMGWSYKKNVFLLILFLWLDKIVDTATVIDGAIDADMKDYQHYLSGERIDGAFATVSLYMNTAIGMVTDLFLPWVKKQYGLTDNYDDFYDETFRNRILDVMLKISVVGAVIDCVPYYFYNISETKMQCVTRVLKLRTLVEDSANGMAGDMQMKEGGDAVLLARRYAAMEKQPLSKEAIKQAKRLPKENDVRKNAVAEARNAYKAAKKYNEDVEVAAFVREELKRFKTPFGKAQLALSQLLIQGGENGMWDNAEQAAAIAEGYPHETRTERQQRNDLRRDIKRLQASLKYAKKYYPDGIVPCDPHKLDLALQLPDETKEQRSFRKAAIHAAEQERSRYGRTAKPYLLALRTVQLAEGYDHIDDILSGHNEAVTRLSLAHAQRLEEERQGAARKKASRRSGQNEEE